MVAPGQVGADLVVSRGVRDSLLPVRCSGTSGYEEAAALGFLAGVNAVLRRRGERPFVPAREESYLGVLVDDLVTREHVEPYRMFTSRAEHRLLLGVDSARERLMAEGVRLGLVRQAVFHVEHRALGGPPPGAVGARRDPTQPGSARPERRFVRSPGSI